MQLFDRIGRTVRLTPEGRVFLADATRQALPEIDVVPAVTAFRRMASAHFARRHRP